jgi:hypothetical protein
LLAKLLDVAIQGADRACEVPTTGCGSAQRRLAPPASCYRATTCSGALHDRFEALCGLGHGLDRASTAVKHALKRREHLIIERAVQRTI